MDNNKKIIVMVVALIMLVMLVVMFKFLVFDDSEEEKIGQNRILISMPSVNENELEDSTKKEKYDKENTDGVKENPFTDLLEEEKKEKNTIKQDVSEKPFAPKKSKRKKSARKKVRQSPQDEELRMILEMQKQIEDEQRRTGIIEERQVPQAYTLSDVNQAYGNGQNNLNGFSNNAAPAKNGFYGVTNNASTEVRRLIPAETVDQGYVIQGSTIAIRTKEAMNLTELGIVIPKNAIVYGKAFFKGADRLDIDIVSYKTNNKLYNLKLQVYDFDGREGVHLGNRSWTKIPAKVSNDVYKYGYQKGTQGSTFGGENTTINLDEAKDVALLSASKEVSKEIFDKRRVKIPRKYNLWINIDTDNF